MYLGTNSAQRVTITSTGNVGIGTTAPGAKLEVYGSARLGSDNTTALPASSAGGGVHLSWNRSSGSAEMNFYNIYDNALSSFEFLQKTGASTASTLYNMGTSGHVWYVSNAERVRITSGGAFKASNAGTYVDATAKYHELYGGESAVSTLVTYASNASFAHRIVDFSAARAATSSYQFLLCNSGAYASTDTEFNLRGDGQAYADGSWTGGGADYAEYFEWSDSNPDAEDRRGISVVLDGDKIRPAVAGEDPIGVISGNPSVVGDAAWNKWSGKYLRDEFGTYILEDYEVTDDDGNTVTQQRRKLNPAYDPDVEYTSREERPEWDCVGLMGKLRIRKGQPTGSRWIKMRDISDSVEEWLVR
ncbi:hypothetical protein EBT31_01720 [bacterium]|nr:hypothetical protein [bacterium]